MAHAGAWFGVVLCCLFERRSVICAVIPGLVVCLVFFIASLIPVLHLLYWGVLPITPGHAIFHGNAQADCNEHHPAKYQVAVKKSRAFHVAPRYNAIREANAPVFSRRSLLTPSPGKYIKPRLNMQCIF